MLRFTEFLGVDEVSTASWRNIEEYGHYLVSLGYLDIAKKFFEVMRDKTGRADKVAFPLVSEIRRLLEEKRVSDARVELEHLTAHNQQKWGPWKIEILAQIGELEEALQVAYELGRQNPHCFPIWNWIFKIYIQNGLYEKAVDTFQKNETDHWRESTYDYWRMVQALKAGVRVSANYADSMESADFLELMNALCQGDGLRHNYWLDEEIDLMSFCPVKENSPVEQRDFNSVEFNAISVISSGKNVNTVVDIGGADGYFSYKFASEGKSVLYIERDPLYFVRASVLFRYFHVDENIEKRLIPMSTWSLDREKSFDLCLALGLIYHIDNCFSGLCELLKFSNNLVIETSDKSNEKWTPKQAINFKDGDEFSCQWLIDQLINWNFDILESINWRNYADKYNKSRTRRLFLASGAIP